MPTPSRIAALSKEMVTGIAAARILRIVANEAFNAARAREARVKLAEAAEVDASQALIEGG